MQALSNLTSDLVIFRPVAGVLMSYSRGCDAVLGLMTEPSSAPAPRSPVDSASDGYHSDSDEHVPLHCPPQMYVYSI